MSDSLRSLVASGTKLWLDSIDPDLVVSNKAWGATGATSNPVIVSDLIKTGRFDTNIERLIGKGLSDNDIAWQVTDELVRKAQGEFLEVWERTKGDDGYVSFELEPLLEDPGANISHADRVRQYIELGKKWSAGHKNRMIKVPATPAGLDALEELCAAGITLNVTLIFSPRQYEAARNAVWRGAQRRADRQLFKSVYSIFVSRVDVYTEQQVTELSPAAQGQVGIVNAKRIWQANARFWAEKGLPLKQEMIFASTGTKKKTDSPVKYVAAFAGSDIETNPPSTNDAVAKSGVTFKREVDQLPSKEVLDEIDQKVDIAKLERVLMEEGVAKFADPQKALLKLIAEKRKSLNAQQRSGSMLLFKKKFLDLIRSGEKTQTIRIWPHRKYRAGQRSYIPGVGYIAIETIDALALDDLTDRDAQLDGFATATQLREELAQLYPEGLAGGQQAFRVRFRVLSAIEQAEAIEEKERRKSQSPS